MAVLRREDAGRSHRSFRLSSALRILATRSTLRFVAAGALENSGNLGQRVLEGPNA
jgi:hypothetical protein